jgi:hypothetical protein
MALMVQRIAAHHLVVGGGTKVSGPSCDRTNMSASFKCGRFFDS